MGSSIGPKIIFDSVLLSLDAANTRSYPGSGNTWSDLTDNARNLTLLNTPTYSSSSPGYITFASASSQYGTFGSPSNISNFTVEAWVYFNSLPAVNAVPTIVTQTYPGLNSRINFSLGFNGVNGTGAYDGKLNGGFYDGTWRLTGGFTPVINTWYYTAVTYDGTTVTQYSNGASQSTLNYIGTPTGSGSSSIIMKRWDTAEFINGRLSQVRLYSRSLSAAEILDNYNSSKSRYGL